MQDSGWETHIKSIAGALPIMLGDPRKPSDTDRKKYRMYADSWILKNYIQGVYLKYVLNNNLTQRRKDAKNSFY